MKNKITFLFIPFLISIFTSFFSFGQTVINGSITGTPVGNNQLNNAAGWTGCGFSPDLLNETFASYSGNSAVTPCASPDGGSWLGLAELNECAYTNITGLTVGESYLLDFYIASFGTGTTIFNNTPSSVRICVGSTCQDYTTSLQACAWTLNSLSFTATSANMQLRVTYPQVRPFAQGGYISVDGFSISILLPIDLVKFELKEIQSQVLLEWQTLPQSNSESFIIEKSKQGVEWIEVSQIKGTKNSNNLINYTYIDEYPFLGISYYRLKKINDDGKIYYSPIQAIEIQEEIEYDINIYPNPAQNKLNITSSLSKLDEVSVYNSLGQDVSKKITIIDKSNNKITINISKLEKGLYYIKALNYSKSFLKN